MAKNNQGIVRRMGDSVSLPATVRCRLAIAAGCATFSQGVEIVIAEGQAHYLSHVLRCQPGQFIALFDGVQDEWLAEITHLAKKQVIVRLSQLRRKFTVSPNVTLAFAPIKFGRIDYLIEKATELGVTALQPVITDYTQTTKLNETRLKAHIIEAAEQSERTDLPVLLPIRRLPDWLKDWQKQAHPLLWGDETGQQTKHPSTVLAAEKPKGWAVLIGPEGGFSSAEHKALHQMSGSHAVSLGPRILRADTAAITLLSLSLSHWGDWEIAPDFINYSVSS